ncbi:hypothetical protein ACXHXM_34995|nr:hypothetical protein [Rhizobium altiplani]
MANTRLPREVVTLKAPWAADFTEIAMIDLPKIRALAERSLELKRN